MISSSSDAIRSRRCAMCLQYWIYGIIIVTTKFQSYFVSKSRERWTQNSLILECDVASLRMRVPNYGRNFCFYFQRHRGLIRKLKTGSEKVFGTAAANWSFTGPDNRKWRYLVQLLQNCNLACESATSSVTNGDRLTVRRVRNWGVLISVIILVKCK